MLADAYSGLAEVDDKEGHTIVACSSVAIASENLAAAQNVGADVRKRIQERIGSLSPRCR